MAIAVRDLPTTKPEARPLPDYGLFDILRFLLASTVVLDHIGVITWEPAGNLAVQVFFALSGWLIGAILCRTEARGLPRFYFNRSTRIWIPYFCCVAALYTVSYLHEPVRSSRWGEFLTYDVTFTHDWFSLWPHAQQALAAMPLKGTGNHFWSLAVEEQFYLICPMIMLLPFGKRLTVWAAIALLALISGYYYGSITLGVFSAMIAYRYPGWQYTYGALIGIGTLLGASIAALLLAPGAYVYTSPFFAISTVLLCSQRTPRLPLGRTLGGISFPLYLNAWLGIFAFHLFERRWHLPAWSALEYASALAAGTVCYFLIDAPIMAKRSRYFRPAVGLACGIVGFSLVLAGVFFWLHRYA